MGSEDFPKRDRIMLVSSNPADNVQKSLLATGSEIVRAHDGPAALDQAQHTKFDMAVLVSTGKAMDVAETVFNLRDISPSMAIIIIADDRRDEAEVVAHACPNARALASKDLAAYLGLFQSAKIPAAKF
jgi:PleD family two-component response regulator